MSEPLNTTGTENEAPNGTETSSSAQGTEDKKKETDWVAEARKWEQRAKENKQAADELAEIKKQQAAADEAKKDELTKATERAEKAEREAAETKAQLLRSQVAAAKGLTEAQAKRLTGSTKEELEADADDLLASFKVEPKKANQVIPGKPKDGVSTPNSGEIDPKAMVDELFSSGRR